jgi:adenylate kinase
MILVLLGPPGSGKGTQAKQLVTEKKWPQVSTGDMLRAAISKGTKLGLEAKSFIDKGALVPDTVVIGLIEERTAQPDSKGGFILDGFPRTIPQAEALDQLLGKQKRMVERAVLFDVADSELVSRLSGRRTCPKCSAVYHIDTQRPKTSGICDKCGSELIQRDDDRKEVIMNRLKVYHQQTSPLIDFYRKQGKLRTIDAAKSPEDVNRALGAALK